MITITLRDLQFRRRQFGIAVVGAALVFALTLVLTGMSAGFRSETEATIRAVGTDAWVVPSGVDGPFSSDATITETSVAAVGRLPGVREAAPFVEFQHRAGLPGGEQEQINVIGQAPGALAPPPGQAVVSERLGVEEGDKIAVGGRTLEVIRLVEGSYFAGVPIVFLGFREAQQIGFGGQRLVSAVVTEGTPPGERLPAGLTVRDNAQVEADLRTPVENAASTIDAVRLLMWLVAALIIGAVVYLSALERMRDFAVLKAVGGSSRTLAVSLTAQAVLAALLSAVLAVGVARLMEPAVTIPVVNEPGAVVLVLGVSVLVGVLSSLVALRRALSVDPALAFSG